MKKYGAYSYFAVGERVVPYRDTFLTGKAQRNFTQRISLKLLYSHKHMDAL